MSNLFSSGGACKVGFSGETQQARELSGVVRQARSWSPASGGNRETGTWSGGVKRGNLNGIYYLFGADVQ